MLRLLRLTFLLTLLAGAARAQVPAAVALAGPAAGLACSQAHRAQAQRTAQALPVSVRHRRKMDRYDVQWYKLDLNLTNLSSTVSGSALLRVRVLKALDSVAFELYQAPAVFGGEGYVIDSVVAGGRRSPGILRRGQEVTAALAQAAPAGTTLDVKIYYRGKAPSSSGVLAGGNGLRTYTSYRLDGTYRAYNVTSSLSEPFSAHEWFPCKQELTDKADSAAIFISTAATNKVGSNGVLRRTVALSGGRVRYEWTTRHPIAYYLLSVAVAPYVEYVNYAHPTGGPTVPIVNYVYDQTALNFYKAQMDLTPGFIENYSSLVGTYYFADEKYGHCTSPIGGGMEHQTMTTQDGFTFTLTAHELFHQWFGDNVTCASWEDIWLNEAFASYGEYLSLQAFSTPAAARAWMDDAQSRAQLEPGGTVRVADTTNDASIFNYNLTYKKGASVVHMLRYLCHDDTRFFRVLRTYQQQYSGRTARTADLQRLFEAELGTSLTYFFDQWYRGRNFPTYTVRWNQVGSQLYLQANSAPFFRTDVDYLLTFSSGATQTVRFTQTQATQGFGTPVSGTVQSITVDPDGWLPDLPGSVTRDNTLVLAAAAASAAPALALYPNPTTGLLRLGTPPPTATTAEVRDALGGLVLRQSLPAGTAEVSVASLPPGLYLLRVLNAGGTVLGQGRFVRE